MSNGFNGVASHNRPIDTQGFLAAHLRTETGFAEGRVPNDPAVCIGVIGSSSHVWAKIRCWLSRKSF